MNDDILEHFINGKHVKDTYRTQDVFNLAIGEILEKVALKLR